MHRTLLITTLSLQEGLRVAIGSTDAGYADISGQKPNGYEA